MAVIEIIALVAQGCVGAAGGWLIWQVMRRKAKQVT